MIKYTTLWRENEFLKANDDYLSLKKEIDDLEIKWF